VHSNGASAEPAKGGSAAGSFFAALSGAAQGASANPLLATANGGGPSKAASGQDGKGGAEAEGAEGFSLAQGGDDTGAPAASGDASLLANAASPANAAAPIPALLSLPFPIANLAQQEISDKTPGADAKGKAGDVSDPSSKPEKADTADPAATSHPAQVATNVIVLPLNTERLPAIPVHGYAAAGGKADAQPNRNGVLPLPNLPSATDAAEHAAAAGKDAAGKDGAKQLASGDGSVGSANPDNASSAKASSANGPQSAAGQGFTVPTGQTAFPAVNNAANGDSSANFKGDPNPLLSANSNGGSTSTSTGSSSDAGKTDTTNGAVVTPAQAAVVSGQIPQHAQADAAQVAASPGKAPDGGVADVQLAPARAAGNDAGLPQRAAGGAGDLPRQDDLRGDAIAESRESAALSGVNVAKLVQAISGTEVHVGVSSAEFGDISIRASVSQQQVLAQISLNHNDLGQAILAHVATTETKLGNEYGLQTSIAVHHQGAATAGGSGQSPQGGQGGHGRSGNGGGGAQPVEIASGGFTPVSVATAVDVSRLDIQA
jgi:hypothetical protein